LIPRFEEASFSCLPVLSENFAPRYKKILSLAGAMAPGELSKI
jgi:hypothetical protein